MFVRFVISVPCAYFAGRMAASEGRASEIGCLNLDEVDAMARGVTLGRPLTLDDLHKARYPLNQTAQILH